MLAFVISAISYILAGLGLGGGVLLIPSLVSFFEVSQIDAGYISLLAYIPAGILICILSKNTFTFYKIIKLIPFGIIGSILGSIIAQQIDVSILKDIYAVFMIVFGVYLFIKNSSIFNKKDQK